MQLTLIRHGQSEGNAGRLWQGAGNTPLTLRGRKQAAALGRRIDLGDFDYVVSSHLDRAIETARLAGFEPEIRPGLSEMNLGEWEGLTFDEVSRRYSDDLAAMRAGENIRWGRTGETFEEFSARVTGEIRKLLANADPDDRILVVAHGGTNNTVLRSFIPGEPRMFQVFGPPANTSITRITLDETGRATIERYNDAAHLGPVDDWVSERTSDGAVVLDLVRHGITDANRDRRVQGSDDWGLAPDGEYQARRLASWIGEVKQVYTSPLGRATRTAELAFPGARLEPEDGLMEIAMGAWQGELWEEIAAREADVIHQLETGAADLPRGGHGETFADVQARLLRTMDAIAMRHHGERIAAVSHGMALRSYLAGLVGLDHTNYRTLQRLDNTAFSRVVVTDDGPLIAAYNLRFHLDH